MFMPEISMQEMVGKGYADFWNFKGRYVACKGSRASKKSKTAALWIISHIVQYPEANAIYIRKTERTLKDSCYSDCKWAIHRMGLDKWFTCRLSPLEIEYKKTGQRILFRGCDDPLKLTSISVPKGHLCWAVFEEAYEITKESDFDMIDESIRGELPPGYFKRIFILLNPWSEKTWIKRRFFDPPNDDNKLAITTTYKCNEWLTPDDLRIFDDMRIRNPRRYAVAGEGQWGITDGLVYENWREEKFDVDEIRKRKDLSAAFGLDFGYTNDPSTLFCGLLDEKNKQLFVFDEMYEKGMSNKRIAECINSMGYGKERITADSAEPKSIDELKSLGLRVKAATKGKDSIKNGIQWIQDLEIIIHPRCANFITEISNYTWNKDKFGTMLNEPIDDFNHLMDAMRYALERYIVGNKWTY
jgi:phage terminase large subunit